MSAAVGAVSATKDVTFNPHMEEELNNNEAHRENETETETETEAEEEEDESKFESDRELLDLGPQVSLKEQLEKDKVVSSF